jgi:hypothetical protein
VHPDSDSLHVGFVNVLEAQICSGGSCDLRDRNSPLNRKTVIAAHPAVNLGCVELEFVCESLYGEARNELSKLSDPRRSARPATGSSWHTGPSIHRRE